MNLNDFFKNKVVIHKTANNPDINNKYRWFRHYNPELRNLSDERIEELMEQNSAKIDKERYKAEAWDKLGERLGIKAMEYEEDYQEDPSNNFIYGFLTACESVQYSMQEIYEEVKADDL